MLRQKREAGKLKGKGPQKDTFTRGSFKSRNLEATAIGTVANVSRQMDMDVVSDN